MNTNISVHVADESHIDAIVRLKHGLFVEDSGPRDAYMNLNWPLEHGHDYIRWLQKIDHGVCLVALDDILPVGYLTGYVKEWKSTRPIRIVELESIFVDSGYRSLGIGSQLVDQFMVWSNEQEAARISVNAYATNEGAIRFYERHGFVPRSTTLEVSVE